MRITKETKAIADAHIQAQITGKFDNPQIRTKEELIQALKDGKTFESLLREIELRYCSITSLLISSQFDYTSKSYISNIYKGFKTILP